MATLKPYLEDYHRFKERLFDLYAAQGARLSRKDSARGGGTSWGYQLAAWGQHTSAGKLTGSSIGDDEVRVFFDLCQLTRPQVACIIGNGFGLSTFCLALAMPGGRIAAIDNWSEGMSGIAARDLSLAIAASLGECEVHILTGTSPADTDRLLHESLGGPETIDLVFIDGMHTDLAARADFSGVRKYLASTSLVLWHNVHATKEAFAQSSEEAAPLWDQRLVLRTYGPLGLYFNSTAHPHVLSYLTDFNLTWFAWEKNLAALMAAGSVSPAGPASPQGWWPSMRRIARRMLKAAGMRRTPSMDG